MYVKGNLLLKYEKLPGVDDAVTSSRLSSLLWSELWTRDQLSSGPMLPDNYHWTDSDDRGQQSAVSLMETERRVFTLCPDHGVIPTCEPPGHGDNNVYVDLLLPSPSVL